VADARQQDRTHSASGRILSSRFDHATAGPADVRSQATETRSIASSGSPTRQIGRYALHAEIAAGGMATVHIGRLLGPVGFARTVAIKRLHVPFAKDPEFVASFLDEARLAARIRHPNVVSTLDVVATEGELFVVMEYVLGESLAQLMRLAHARGERVATPIAAAIMVGVLHGLHAAHEARDERGEPLGIVHRDVSPHNILVGTDGAPHVIDFGVAKARGRAQVTRDGQIKGKLSYMPPEQLLGNPIDQRADVFAASIVLWEALTGRRLFHGVDDGDILARVLYGQVEPPSAYAHGLSLTMDSVVLRGLARDWSKRYQTAREMALAIEAATPLAPPSQVGSWVEKLARDELAERTRQVADIEREASLGDTRESASSMALSTFAVDSQTTNLSRESIDGTGASLQPELGRARPTVQTRRSRSGSPAFYRGVVSQSSSRGVMALVRESFADATSRASTRAVHRIIAVLAAAVVTLAVVGALRFRSRTGAVADVPPQIANPIEARPVMAAPPSPPVPATASAAPTPAETIAAPRPAYNHRSPPTSPSFPSTRLRETTGSQASDRQTRAAHPEASVRPALSAAPGTPSCDPPFWYDSEGNKRYYRHCASL
jgi:eukaryotic-like serine/threonine-protein kinase